MVARALGGTPAAAHPTGGQPATIAKLAGVGLLTLFTTVLVLVGIVVVLVLAVRLLF